jgi:hypothetical protein
MTVWLQGPWSPAVERGAAAQRDRGHGRDRAETTAARYGGVNVVALFPRMTDGAAGRLMPISVLRNPLRSIAAHRDDIAPAIDRLFTGC